ncbi:MAG TPA: peptidoglycan editing factor PgeF [Alcanivoracaceae bacterium]|nr:peptidoglycan editing factor PgeF [Alcanivoracaceae bacterium]
MSSKVGEDWLVPTWRPHENVRVCVTTNAGDFSPAPWQGFNLGLNTGDNKVRVAKARQHVWKKIGTKKAPFWLDQVHGKELVEYGSNHWAVDGVWTTEPSAPCVVLTADCLPVLLARCDGSAVAAVHAGWRGVEQGILQAAVKQLAPKGEALAAWVGPAISADEYQVGEEVYRAFQSIPNAETCFSEDPEPNRWRCDLAGLAALQLEPLGVQVTKSGLCTASDPQQRFYSYRKQGQTGRFASLIWLAE